MKGRKPLPGNFPLSDSLVGGILLIQSSLSRSPQRCPPLTSSIQDLGPPGTHKPFHASQPVQVYKAATQGLSLQAAPAPGLQLFPGHQTLPSSLRPTCHGCALTWHDPFANTAFQSE